jgi:hypothetical protein
LIDHVKRQKVKEIEQMGKIEIYAKQKDAMD